MGDIAQILAPTAATVPKVASSNSKAVELAGMSKEAMYLLKGKQDLSSASLPPVVPTFAKLSTANGMLTERKSLGGTNTNTMAGISTQKGDNEEQQTTEVKVKVGSKLISSSKRARPWAWAPFASSGRSDGAMFRHWVRKNVEYTDYPYAKFDIHMDPVTYTPEEYAAHLQSETWTRSETDRLMELARIFECRWPVIFDRFCFENSSNHSSPNKKSTGNISSTSDSGNIPSVGMTSSRKIEDLQHRYYGVAAILVQLRIAQEAASEARALSVAAAKSASTAPPPVTTPSTPTITTVTSAIAGTTPATGPTTSTDRISAVAKHQERTDNLLLESAAARSLATSAKQHQPLITHVGTGTSNKMFDFEREQERRHHLDRLWRRSKEEEEEELQLRKELKTIDAQLRKLKKNGGHILAARTTKTAGRAKTVATASRAVSGQSNGLSSQVSNTPSSRGPSRSTTPNPSAVTSSMAPGDQVNNNDNKSTNNSDIVERSDALDEYFASTAPVPMSQYPYLQSGRLVPPATGGSSGINKSLLARMNEVLGELNISDRPIPTKRVCDMYDLVRKDVLTLLTLKKMLMQREGQLQSKRLRLSRMGGSMLAPEDKILDEERLLGIAPPPKPSSSAATGNSSSAASKAKTTKRKSTSGAGGKSKASSKKGSADTKSVAGTTVKKKTVKRKRKVDPGKSLNLASSSVSSKSPAVGSAAAKAAKARTTSAIAAGGNVVPKVATAPRSSSSAANNVTRSNAIGEAAALPVVLPKVAKTSAAGITALAAVGGKSNDGSAAKRPRKA
jgi:DNA methyltransferase 1-associated protein 1